MFIINGLLGEGGFGKVTTAMFIESSSWYAIKTVNKDQLTRHKSGISMIFSELRALERLQHNHRLIVNLHFAFHDKTNCHFVLDLKTGGDLRYYIKKKTLFEEADVAFYVACISSALRFIHSKFIIHRDIKPGKNKNSIIKILILINFDLNTFHRKYNTR